jgi:glycosyltransferase involved in cell wall biosynthesis
VLLYVGGFDPTKNVPFLFEALARVGDPSVVLCVAGDPGGAGEELRAASSGEGLDGRVVWLGRLSEEALAAAYRAADLFVSSSIYEGFGLPALEAMACGCPVVALTAGPVPEVIGQAALGVDEKSPEAFAAAIRRAIERDEVRDDLIFRGLARARELSWERTAMATLDLYRELAGARREGGGSPPARAQEEGDS